MAFVYLSPSTQEFNPYIGGGNEEQYMNQIADEMEGWFRSCGISFTRNRREMTAAQVIAQSNALGSDLHLALHSNAAPEALSGILRGTDIYYSDASPEGKRAAELIAANLKTIYPLPEKVRVLPGKSIGEVNRIYGPAVLIEFAYHDNEEDAQWIRDNAGRIAENVAASVARFFALPVLVPKPARSGVVDVRWGSVNIRTAPSLTAPIAASVADDTRLTVWNEYQDWFVVDWNGVAGYAFRDFITIVYP